MNETPSLSAVVRAQELTAANPTDIVAVYDMSETLVWASPSHLSILGYTPEESVGRHWREFVAPEDHDHADLAGSDALLNGRSIEFGFRAATKQGSRVPMRGTAWITVDPVEGLPYLVFQGTPQKK